MTETTKETTCTRFVSNKAISELIHSRVNLLPSVFIASPRKRTPGAKTHPYLKIMVRGIGFEIRRGQSLQSTLPEFQIGARVVAWRASLGVPHVVLHLASARVFRRGLLSAPRGLCQLPLGCDVERVSLYSDTALARAFRCAFETSKIATRRVAGYAHTSRAFTVAAGGGPSRVRYCPALQVSALNVSTSRAPFGRYCSSTPARTDPPLRSPGRLPIGASSAAFFCS